jgi:uncharacterized membrane protein YtjA (UPF0391 family)
MLSWSFTFLVIALIADASTNTARIFFYLFLVLLALSALFGAFRGKTPR